MSAIATISATAATVNLGSQREPVSEARLRANRENAQRSTGPRTEAGKARSRTNASKHYMRALVVTKDEDSAEVEALRIDFIESLGACNAATTKLADLAFRCVRRFETVLDAEDAAVAAQVNAADAAFHEKRWNDFCDTMSLSEHEPIAARYRFETTARGCTAMLEMLDCARDHLLTFEWSEESHAFLTRAAGIRYVPMLAEIDDWSSTVIKHQAAAKKRETPDFGVLKPPHLIEVESDMAEFRAEGLTLTDSLVENHRFHWNRWNAEREQARQTLDRDDPPLAVAAFAAAREGLLTFLDQEHELLITMLAELDDEEESALAIARAQAKFDPSDAARLRHRYAADARRDLSRSLDDVRKAVTDVRKQPAPSPAPEPTQVDDPATPNEPKREQPSQPARVFQPSKPETVEQAESAELTSETDSAVRLHPPDERN